SRTGAAVFHQTAICFGRTRWGLTPLSLFENSCLTMILLRTASSSGAVLRPKRWLRVPSTPPGHHRRSRGRESGGRPRNNGAGNRAPSEFLERRDSRRSRCKVFAARERRTPRAHWRSAPSPRFAGRGQVPTARAVTLSHAPVRRDDAHSGCAPDS